MSDKGIQAVDSLSANEFHVEVDGEMATGIFSVSGVYSLSIDPRTGDHLAQPLVITKMVQQDPELPFNRWTRATLADRETRVTRILAIVAMDEGEETRRWVYPDAWISKIEFSDFDSASDTLIEERLTIQSAGVDEQWPIR